MPVLFITGSTEQAVFGDGALLPDMEIMTKAFTMNSFASKIAKMLKFE